uniref:Uncharacterized protein n=1 Tax=Xiphophorus maculatus TaxID=8083 RepID=A0A3B5Q281_XIPMA
MESWKIQLVVVTFCVLVQTSKGSTSGAEDERRLSRHWQVRTTGLFQLYSCVINLMKRSKALRFYGLMGKRLKKKNFLFLFVANKRVAFVDLMGRSVSSEGEQLLKTQVKRKVKISRQLYWWRRS